MTRLPRSNAVRSSARALLGLGALALVAGASFTPGSAHAGIPVIYTNGDVPFESGPLPEPFDKIPTLAGAKAGWVCDVFGLFWAYFSFGKCRPAAIKENTIWTDPKLQAAIAAKYPEPTIGFWNKNGRWILLAALIALIAIPVVSALRKKKDKGTDDSSGAQPA